MDTSDFKALDHLNTEIIILDGKSFELLWVNDSAKAANWIGDSTMFEGKTISSLLDDQTGACLLYTSPSPRDATLSRMPSSA